MPEGQFSSTSAATARSTLALVLSALCLGVTLLVSRYTLDSYQARETLQPTGALKKGDQLPALTLRSLETKELVRLSFGKDAPLRVLYLMSAGCPYSEENLPLANELYRQLSRGKVEMVGLTNDWLPPSVKMQTGKELGYELPVLQLTDAAARALVVRATPATIVVDSDGKVQWWMSGVFGLRHRAALTNTFGVRLPDASGNL